jgi:hypothetical protein
MAKLLPGFKGLGGTAKQVLNEKTGEILSRRKYAEQVKRGGLLKNEELAALNKAQDYEAQISRPAKGRKSIQKLAPEFKSTVAKVRIEGAKETAARLEKIKREKIAARKIEQLLGQQIVKVPKVTLSILRPGDKGRRIAFNDYSEYETIREQAEKSGHVLAIGIGAEGIDPRTDPPKKISFTVFTMLPISQQIDEDEFDEAFQDAIEAKNSYFVFLHYWAHLAFKRKSYEQRAKSGTKTKRNPRGKGKGKTTKKKKGR